MKTLLLTVLLSFAVPAYAQMSMFQDTMGTQGMVMPNGPNQGMFWDNTGRSGQYQRNGNQGLWQDNQGRTGQWMDIGPNQKAFTDNQGGHGQSFDFGNGMGSYTYQTPKGTTQGQIWQYSR